MYFKNILINQYKNSPIGPIKYVINKGIKFTYLDILNFWLSFTIQQPQNKFTPKKWIQNNNKNAFSENKLRKSSKPRYKEKFWL